MPKRNGVGALHSPAIGAAVFGALFALALPAQACPFGPRPTQDDVPFVAACAGSGFNLQDNAVLSFRTAQPLGGFLVTASADESPSNGLGGVYASARVSETLLGELVLNPDLHASALVVLRANGDFLPGEGYAIASASFRDVIVIKAQAPGPHPDPSFRVDFDLTGLLRGTDLDGGATLAWANVSMNLSLIELGSHVPTQPGARNVAGLEMSTLEGLGGHQSQRVSVELDVEVGKTYILSGNLDVVATGNASGPSEARGAADFSNSLRFSGMHFFTDATHSQEYSDLSVQSAFGFDYRLASPVVNEVPEPGGCALLAAAGVVAVLRRGRQARRACGVTWIFRQ